MPMLSRNYFWAISVVRRSIYPSTPGATLSRALLQGKSHALLLLDTWSNTVSTLVSPGEITVDELHWSPDSKFLTYEQVSTQGKASLHTFMVEKQKEAFSLTLKQLLQGLSWSPGRSV